MRGTECLFIYFLLTLPCKKINPPSLTTFAGPGIHKIEIIKIIKSLNIPVWPFRFINGTEETGKEEEYMVLDCTLIGDTVIQPRLPDVIIGYTKLLVQHFGLPYLCARYITPDKKNYFLRDVFTVPDISPEANCRAIATYFLNDN